MDIRDTINIINLPDEIIALILVNNDPRDILHFSATCKKFLKLVSNNDYLWKKKYSEIVPNAVVKLVNKHNDGNWLKKSIQYSEVKETVCLELLCMPHKYLNHWTSREMFITDAKGFFTMATKNNLNYIYTICNLQEIIKKGESIIDTNQCIKPLYTLTTIYCAEKVLGYLLHTYLTLKWLQKEVKKELTPVFVINFFLQWIDVTMIYSDEDVEQKIQSLVTRVEAVLEESHSELKSSPRFGRKIYTEKQVLQAITKVVYNNNKVSSNSPNSNTLNIVKVIDENDGYIITYGAIYQAVATRFGLKCELIAFPNHLYLEWQCTDEKNKSYTINPLNGEIRPKRQCPYSRGSRTNYKYCPKSLLEFLYTSYMENKGGIRSRETQNAMYFCDFLGDHNNNPYHKMRLYMHTEQYAPSLATGTPINMECLEDEHLNMMLMLSQLDEKRREGEVVNPSIDGKTRNKAVKYAVGMICYHTTHNYVCVVRGWDVPSDNHTRMSMNGHFRAAKDQPFYWVMAGDHSERYVSQRNLEALLPPCRMKDLEHSLAREFTHFDGFSYVLNDQKVLEYPNETPYIEAFKRK